MDKMDKSAEWCSRETPTTETKDTVLFWNTGYNVISLQLPVRRLGKMWLLLSDCSPLSVPLCMHVWMCVCKDGMMASFLLCEVRGSWLVKQYLTIQKQMDLTESRGASLGQTKHKQEGGDWIPPLWEEEWDKPFSNWPVISYHCVFVCACWDRFRGPLVESDWLIWLRGSDGDESGIGNGADGVKWFTLYLYVNSPSLQR